MARKPIIRNNRHPYHVTARCNNKDWYSVPLGVVWSIYRNILRESAEKYGIRVTAFVLMGNHFHAVVYTPQANIDSAMRHFMRQSSLAIGSVAGRINKIYGGRYKSTLILTDAIEAKVLKYVYRNPVKAGICANVEEYQFSTLNMQNNFPLACDEVTVEISKNLEYLNTPEPKEIDDGLKRALRWAKVDKIRDRVTRKRIV